MQWFDIATPALAVLALFLGVALLVQTIRHSRALRSIEERLTAGGASAGEAPLERLRDLQARVGISSGLRARTSPVAWIATGVVLLALLGAGAWWAGWLGGGGNTTQGSTTAGSGGGTTTSKRPVVAPDATLCGTVTRVSDPGAVTVAVLNASGITGKAFTVQNDLKVKGYSPGKVGYPPDGTNNLKTTAVEYVTQADRTAACNVAQDLAVKPVRAVALEGLTAAQIGDANVVVLLGTDVASR